MDANPEDLPSEQPATPSSTAQSTSSQHLMVDAEGQVGGLALEPRVQKCVCV